MFTILVFIIIGLIIYFLPFLLTNALILGVLVFLSKRKAGWIFNLLTGYVAFNLLRKGMMFWGILFTLLVIIKSINFARIGIVNRKTKVYKEEYKNTMKNLLKEKYINGSNKINDLLENKDLRMDWFTNNYNKNNPKKVITLEDREKYNLYQQVEQSEYEIKKEIELARQRREKWDKDIIKNYNNSNPNIPKDLYKNIVNEETLKYNKTLDYIENDLNSQNNSEDNKTLREEYVDEIVKSINMDYNLINDILNRDIEITDNITNKEKSKFDRKEYKNSDEQLSWVEGYKLNIKSDINNINIIGGDSLDDKINQIKSNQSNYTDDDYLYNAEDKKNKINFDDNIYENVNYMDKLYEDDFDDIYWSNEENCNNE